MLQRRRRIYYYSILSAFFLLVLVVTSFYLYQKLSPRPPEKPFPSTGGESFPVRVIYDIPQFYQDDPLWYHDEIGISGSRMGPEGCAVTAAAMTLDSMGIDTDPGRLNAYLSKTHGGYTARGWIYWEKAAEIQPSKVYKAFEGMGDHKLIDESLKKGLTPIIKIYLPNGVSHFVVVIGKEKKRYLIRDPSSRFDGQIVYLDEAHPQTLIYGVRLYDYR
ncbi:MAG: cysteine peptidase family C39 domain-containing protein [Verrucomicrobiota bacterium]|nr:cysteine peptidase family C39 domain-containing protein [Verrucomicrobiota bacterium]